MTQHRETGWVLDQLADGEDAEIDLALTALALADAARPGRDLKAAQAHLDLLYATLKERVATAGAPEPAQERGALLRAVLVETFGYHGDAETYEDPDNADLIRVMERRRGLPVSLGILYLALARSVGWTAEGLNFPGHFIIRVDGEDGERVILDPFHDGAELSVADLRGLVKAIEGPEAELTPAIYAAVSNREVLIRLQANIKLRALQAGDYQTALATVERMLLVTPEDHWLWRESGLMHMRLGDLDGALAALDVYLTLAPDGTDRDRIAKVVQELGQGRP
ncbi:SirB1 family protein [Novispirillum itersonii]|uniref:Regulator of sirC expression with transglutaminase-like and TPR domain n=1 Tax=Novispirillum itersonii TaxID=189 RepID=A0A7X0DL60_NOVIT|nr:transglutaminase-like domain-containing protein [Novispirillum itersonii]MBB6208819.1 regulator of sirC expression with transglutaminase-like and TPR domain [Novispirillum itersonii]